MSNLLLSPGELCSLPSSTFTSVIKGWKPMGSESSESTAVSELAEGWRIKTRMTESCRKTLGARFENLRRRAGSSSASDDKVPPPAYSAPKSDPVTSGAPQVSADSPYPFLTQFDTVFLIDDSGSMAGRSWREMAQALAAVTPICTSHDADGIDVSFLGHRNRSIDSDATGYADVRNTAAVEEIFSTVRPSGGTRMKQILNPYLKSFEASESQRLHRRGRGRRRNDAYWMAYNTSNDTDPFDGRECVFEGGDGKVTMPALANLDTGLKVPGGLIMSSHYAKEIGRYQDISKDFVDPCMRSISGHHTTVTGVLRNVVFRLKGTSATFIRDFYVCDAIDGLVDIMIGASFIRDQFKLLFEKVKECFSTFATWFSTKKEDAEEKEERERREREQRIKANHREIARLQREQELLEAQQRRNQQGRSS